MEYSLGHAVSGAAQHQDEPNLSISDAIVKLAFAPLLCPQTACCRS